LAKRTRRGHRGVKARRKRGQGSRPTKPVRHRPKGTDELDEEERFTYQKTFIQNDDD